MARGETGLGTNLYRLRAPDRGDSGHPAALERERYAGMLRQTANKRCRGGDGKIRRGNSLPQFWGHQVHTQSDRASFHPFIDLPYL